MKRLLPILALALWATAHADQATGLWWVAHGDGAPLQIRLYPDGRAWSDYPANNPGRWRLEDGKVVVVWADDWKEVFLAQGQGRWSKQGYRPGVTLGQPPSNHSRAFKVSDAPDGWLGPSRRE